MVRVRWAAAQSLPRLTSGQHGMADVIFCHRPESQSLVVEHTHHWAYVADRLRAHLGPHSPEEVEAVHPTAQRQMPADLRGTK